MWLLIRIANIFHLSRNTPFSRSVGTENMYKALMVLKFLEKCTKKQDNVNCVDDNTASTSAGASCSKLC